MFPYVLFERCSVCWRKKRNKEAVTEDYLAEGGEIWEKNCKASKNQKIVIIQKQIVFSLLKSLCIIAEYFFFFYNNDEGGMATFY